MPGELTITQELKDIPEGAVTTRIAGKVVEMRLKNGAIARIQRYLQTSKLASVLQMVADMDFNAINAIVWSSVLYAIPGSTPDEIGDSIEDDNATLMSKIGQLFEKAFGASVVDPKNAETPENGTGEKSSD